jgi:hypothetical protein
MENCTFIGENVCSWGKVVRSPTAAKKTDARAALAEPRVATRTKGSPCPRPGKPGPPEARNLDRWVGLIVNHGDSHGTCGHDPLPADFAEPSSAADAAFAR